MNRAEFLRWAAGVSGGGLVGEIEGVTRMLDGVGEVPDTESLPRRRLGRTGAEVPILGLGGWHVGDAGSERAAHQLVEGAFAEGIRFFDNAESYHDGRSERWMGGAIATLGIRKEVFLMTKTFNLGTRSRASAQRHLEGSLARLRTDYLDLWQLHSVRTEADVDRAFAPGGAMEYLLEMQRQGVVRHVGVTGHQDPAANLRALHWFDRGITFDAMQMPVNPVDYHHRSFQRTVLPELLKRDIGVIAMKTSADGRLLRAGVCSAEECHRYAWSLPVAVAVVGMERLALVRENARRAREFAAMREEEREGLLGRVRGRGGTYEPYKLQSS